MAVKLLSEIARAQASSRHPVGHILRRLIDISQIAVQKNNFWRLQKAVALCSMDEPFNNIRVSITGTPQGDGVNNSEYVVIKKLYILKKI